MSLVALSLGTFDAVSSPELDVGRLEDSLLFLPDGGKCVEVTKSDSFTGASSDFWSRQPPAQNIEIEAYGSRILQNSPGCFQSTSIALTLPRP